MDLKDMTLLVVDDEERNLRLLTSVLDKAGYTDVVAVAGGKEAIAAYERIQPDVVLLDLHMPDVDGFQVMDTIRTSARDRAWTPILVLTADATRETKERALSSGAKDFLVKPLDTVEVLLRVNNLLETNALHQELRARNEALEEQVDDRTKHLWAAVRDLERSRQEVRTAQEETIERLSVAADFRDDETGQHIRRMSRYAALLAAASGMDAQTCEVLRIATQMHDVGKIGIPDEILLAPRALKDEERAVMQTHAEIGYRILSGRSSLLQLAATIAWTHHERVGGAGYPRNLRGDEIPIEGRICAIADVFDALTSNRVYRAAMELPEAIRMMTAERGSHFDAELLDLFLDGMSDVLSVMEESRSRGTAPT